jgi:lipoprotein-anchoring transpeptidase ErfK/SrfK
MAVGALGVSACSSSGSGSSVTVTQTRSASAPATASGAPSSAPASSTSSSAKPGVPVHVSTALGDGQQVGVGMPIIAFLSRPIKDARAFAAATKVTVNGTAVSGGWYFEPKSGDPATPIEMDYRTANYWPGHAQIHMDLPVKGLSAGTGLAFDNNLTLDFTTGPANILTVDDATHKVTVRSDGSVWGTFPTSLGSTKTPTKRGVKVIMEKGKDISMKGPGYYDPHVKWTQRLTYDGEYLHSAPWNTYNIDHGVDSSNGCTNLHDADAKKLYDFLEIGDVVNYSNASGPRMTLGEGYGDWNLSWQQWQTGGMYRTH